MSKRKKTALKNKLLDAISYSRIYKGNLNTSEIILVHQHMQQGVKLSTKIQNKISKITSQIQAQQWQRPITRIGNHLQIEQLNLKTGTWQIVKS